MKGIEMPISLIVIIAIAVLVLVVLAAFFTSAIGPGTESIRRSAAIDAGCQKLRSIYTCDISKIDTMDVNYQEPGSSVTTTKLGRLCTLENLVTNNECAIRCGCPVPS